MALEETEGITRFSANPPEEDTLEAESPSELTREAELRTRQQLARIERGRKGEEGDVELSAQETQLAARDLANDKISKVAVAASETGFVPFVWFNLQLFKGYLIGRGKDPLISPPSWKPLKIPLPDASAVAAIIFLDLAIATIVLISISIEIIFFALVIQAWSDPPGFVRQNWSYLTDLITPVLQWLGLPSL